jgi:16S rRNA (cytosine967-C5)-methyltransferase
VRQLRHSRAAGFVNAVLRGLLRGGDARKVLPARPTDGTNRDVALDYLSTTLSHPRWLVARWLDRFGLDAAARWCEFNNTSPAVTVRPMAGEGAPALLRDLMEQGVAAVLSPFAPESIRLPAGTLGRLDEDLRARIVIQDEGSQIVALAAGAESGLRVLDVCAAPGGKTALLQSAVGPGGLVIAGDHRPARVRLLQSRLRALGASVPVLALDASTSLPFADTFDRVLLDAPCSGLGTLRRDPDLKWTRTPEDLARLAETQVRMIQTAAGAVRPGGVLTYATCSSEPDENEAVVERFLQSAAGFHREPVTLAAAQAPAAQLIDENGYLHTLPFRDDMDAFFAARLVRSATA